MDICSVNAVRSQKPSPNESTTACGEEPFSSAASPISTTPPSAKM